MGAKGSSCRTNVSTKTTIQSFHDKNGPEKTKTKEKKEGLPEKKEWLPEKKEGLPEKKEWLPGSETGKKEDSISGPRTYLRRKTLRHGCEISSNSMTAIEIRGVKENHKLEHSKSFTDLTAKLTDKDFLESVRRTRRNAVKCNRSKKKLGSETLGPDLIKVIPCRNNRELVESLDDRKIKKSEKVKVIEEAIVSADRRPGSTPACRHPGTPAVRVPGALEEATGLDCGKEGLIVEDIESYDEDDVEVGDDGAPGLDLTKRDPHPKEGISLSADERHQIPSGSPVKRSFPISGVETRPLSSTSGGQSYFLHDPHWDDTSPASSRRRLPPLKPQRQLTVPKKLPAIDLKMAAAENRREKTLEMRALPSKRHRERADEARRLRTERDQRRSEFRSQLEESRDESLKSKMAMLKDLDLE